MPFATTPLHDLLAGIPECGAEGADLVRLAPGYPHMPAACPGRIAM
ncbi:hypothetical protein MNKW57_13650 [Biformimicrobium ophioploci]|uniref:Uncharacterized protein n=1 Tax=Biformimicrobium ophioploci TaxID=3036711 RepID=A0ABQ6LY64_9GAMM|nr:hypothetical protein MNKW57_13650 [Microbulbifer sp. NKW57]